MNITVHYYGQIGQAVGQDRDRIECTASTPLPDLLNSLADRHGDAFRRLVFDDAGDVRKSLLITVNDNAVRSASWPTLQNGDELTLLPPISGG